MSDDPSRRDDRGPAAEYGVGYGKPPKHSQFKPGNAGRRKGSGNKPKIPSLQDLLRDVLTEQIKVQRDGRTVSMSPGDLLKNRLRKMMLQGSSRELAWLFTLAKEVGLSFSDRGEAKIEVVYSSAPGSMVPLPPADLFKEDSE